MSSIPFSHGRHLPGFHGRPWFLGAVAAILGLVVLIAISAWPHGNRSDSEKEFFDGPAHSFIGADGGGTRGGTR